MQAIRAGRGPRPDALLVVSISILIGAVLSGCVDQINPATARQAQSPPRPQVQQKNQPPTRQWLPIRQDGLHDPASPAVEFLQEPREALAQLPSDVPGVGNQVRWVAALQQGLISPRTNIYPETKVEFLDLDVLMKDTSTMPWVLFPHDRHTEWLDCSNCHDKIFKRKAGETPVNMMAILEGLYCGRCHGAVSFPLTECIRCHSMRPDGTPVKRIINTYEWE